MTVWIAWEGTYSDRMIIGAYSSRGRAVRAWASRYVPERGWSGIPPEAPLFVKLDNPDVEEVDVDIDPDPAD